MKKEQHHASWWIEGEAVTVISRLLAVFERDLRNDYHKSEEVARAENLLSYIKQHSINNQ